MKSLIGKNWVDSEDGKVIEVINPATNEVIDTVPSLTKAQVDLAVQEAKKAQKDWEQVPLHKRCDILFKFTQLVLRDKDRLAKLLSDETGKPIKEAITEIANIQIGVLGYVEKAKHE